MSLDPDIAALLEGPSPARDPRMAMSIVDHENPYRTARLRGHVVETRDA